jgi:hypothetical protein
LLWLFSFVSSLPGLIKRSCKNFPKAVLNWSIGRGTVQQQEHGPSASNKVKPEPQLCHSDREQTAMTCPKHLKPEGESCWLYTSGMNK